MAIELGQGFNFNDALQRGSLPLVVTSQNPGEVLRSYAALYLREEIQMEGLVRNIGNFSRFLEAISFSHASILNISNVAQECGVERKTVEGYVEILDRGYSFGLAPSHFYETGKEAIGRTPKILSL